MNRVAPLWESPPKQLSLPTDEVHVWRAGLDLEASRTGKLRALLSPDERERADRFRFPIHRQRFIAARGILRTVLARYLAVHPGELRFVYGPHGKPALAADSLGDGLHFNVAHSENLVLLAVARQREVGVDVECLTRKFDDERIAERFFSPEETARLRALPVDQQREGFFNCWTRKEAYLKARGRGLSLPLDQFTVSLAPGEPARLLATHDGPEDASQWSIQELSPGPGYVGAVAVEGNGWRLRCWESSSLDDKADAQVPA